MTRLLLTLISLTMMLSGCGFKDIDKRFFVLAMGVDPSGNKKMPYRVTLKLGIASPRIEPGQTNKFQLVTQDGESISEAIRLMKSKVDKELDFGHAKIFVFGKSLAEDDIRKPIDWFIRRRDIQSIGYVVIGDPSAFEVLKTSPKSERLPANSLFLSFNQEGTESSFIVTEQLSDFHRRLTEMGKDPYMPVIRPEGDSFIINEAAVLNKKQVVAVLTPEDTRVLHELAEGFTKFDVFTKYDGQRIVLAISSVQKKYSILEKDGKPNAIQVKINLTGQVEESVQEIYDQDWEEIEKISGAQSAKRVLHLLTQLQKQNVDPIGFGLHYRALGHVTTEEWEQWLTLYPQLKMDVSVHIKIISSGVIK